ncbi:serine/threonine-protein kinase [Gemmatimonas groenlandica]|uniref:non-specific serine/threonine protein kinase n=1 Tax=Gemmatimonas groenlandica TaxID=2732249 RepID=A0A6M4IU75_9BACT|nr:serine/threonine-protein kinase [Gemmatimonas groenlandica]QJR37046.1 serine/threonine protein kinase [Gemmatimonas groenlandica]
MREAITDLHAAIGDRFSIERLLGQGGMGAVYLARDRQLDRPVAIKVLPPEFAQQSDLRERFLRETRTAASFSHPNIVPVFSVEDRDGLLAFAMGYVEGESVADLVKRSGPMSVRDTVRMLQDVSYALAYAHSRGVVHRDIKPDNIMIERATGRALVMDFGISRSITATVATPSLTRVGEVVGTPEYMSPEQASGDTIDGRSDLYSLGLVAWFALAGRPAITGDSISKVLVKQLTEAVPPIAQLRADVPALLADVIAQCTNKAPESRFATADELVERLDTSALRSADVPLPIRLFAEEASQAGMVLAGAVIIGFLLLLVLEQAYDTNFDRILPMVLFCAVIWGRLAVLMQQARRLARRRFSISEIQAGFAAVLAEREAERAQLRADAGAVRHRRKQVMILGSLFVASFVLRWYVLKYQRTEYSPGMFGVSLPGAIMLYSAYVTRGLSIVGLLNSPLRRGVGESVFRTFWLGAGGRAVLRLAGRGVRGANGESSAGFRTTDATRAATPRPALTTRPVPMPLQAPAAPSLEARIQSLEAWRDAMDRRN